MRVASNKVKITPEGRFFPCYLSGHAIRTEKAIGILDDTFVEVITLKTNEQQYILISVELIGLEKETTNKLSQRIASKHGIDPDDIIIGFTHTHSGPEYQTNSLFSGKKNEMAGEYMEWVTEKIEEAVDSCLNKEQKKVKVSYKTTLIKGLYGSRNNTEIPGDKEIALVLFKDDKGNVIASICNFACHPTVLGPKNLYVSSDLAGYISRYFEKKYQTNTLVMLGAAGDMSNRLYREGNDSTELERVGQAIVMQIDANDDWKTTETTDIISKKIKYNKVFPISLEKIEAKIKECQYQIDTATSFDDFKVYSSALAGLQEQARNYIPEFELDLEIKYLVIGDISILSIPGEWFSKFGSQIKGAMNNKCNLFWGYSSFNAGYFYTQEDAGKSFESFVTYIPPGVSEEIVDLIIKFV